MEVVPESPFPIARLCCPHVATIMELCKAWSCTSLLTYLNIAILNKATRVQQSKRISAQKMLTKFKFYNSPISIDIRT